MPTGPAWAPPRPGAGSAGGLAGTAARHRLGQFEQPLAQTGIVDPVLGANQFQGFALRHRREFGSGGRAVAGRQGGVARVA